MGTLTEKSMSTGAKALVIGTIAGLAVATIYIIYKRKNKPNHSIKPAGHHVTDLTMERYVFNIATDSGEIPAVVEAAGDCYSVQMGGKYIGNMWQDELKGMQWQTENEELEPYMWEIAVHLAESFSRQGFPSLLMGTYPEIISTTWKTDETLEVNVKPDTDMEVFTTFLKDEVLNLVTFEEHLDLMVKKENEAYFVIIGIN